MATTASTETHSAAAARGDETPAAAVARVRATFASGGSRDIAWRLRAQRIMRRIMGGS